MYKKKSVITLRTQIMKTMIATAILQICIIAGVIIVSNTTGQLTDSKRQSLINTVATKNAALEIQMAEWSDMEEVLAEVNEVTDTFCTSRSDTIQNIMQNPNNRTILLEQMSPLVVQLLRSSKATGSFIILNSEETSQEKDALYLRDMSPSSYSSDNSDIMVEAGPGEFLLQNGYTLDSLWSARIHIDEKSDFYYRPYVAGRQYKNRMEAKDLGYWSSAFRLRTNDIEVITYTVPLIDKNQDVYGVMGIDIAVEFMRSLLGSRDITVDENAGYLLCKSVNGILNQEVISSRTQYRSVITSGTQYQVQIPVGSMIFFENREDDLYKVVFENMKENHIASCQPLQIYNHNTPFEGNQWILAGIVHKDILEQASNSFVFRTSVSMLTALLIGILVAIAISVYTTKPVYELMHGIDKISRSHVSLPKTYIREYDELASEIERTSKELLDNAYKVANIIEMTDLQLGVFEYNENTPRCFCTEKILKIFELDTMYNTWKDNYVNLQEMKRVIKKVELILMPETDENGIYYFNTADNKRKWVSIRKVGAKEQYLCVIMDVTNDIMEKQKIKHDRDFDVLTDLYNRRAFTREVKKIIEEHPETTGAMSVWDLDNLKYMNDTYGHDIGDRYINLLASVFKRIDGNNIIMSRMSGDEFMMFIYDENIAKAYEILRDVHKAFLAEKMVLPDETELSVSASAGMAAYPIDGANYEDLMRYADFAMYEVKNREKGAIKPFSRDTYVRDYILVQGVGELNRILKNGSIYYLFQPIVDVRNKKVFAYEALLRTESVLLRGPDELIRLAESQFKLGQIESMTWLHAIKEFLQETNDCMKYKLFINSIPNQCLNPDEFAYLEENYGNKLANVVMEVTEITKADTECEKKKYNWCRQFGVEIALDDYGTGYSNHDVLMTRELNYVKIDKSIVRDIHMLPAQQKLVKSMIEYCHENHIKVIAEGIELRQELHQVIKLGADYVQGFYLAKPNRRISKMDDILEALF